MDKRLITLVLVAASLGCNGGSASGGGATAAADSVILMGGQAYLMVRGPNVEPPVFASLGSRPTLNNTARISDSVVVIGGQKARVGSPISVSSTSSTSTSTARTYACTVEVHDETKPSTPPKHLFVITC